MQMEEIVEVVHRMNKQVVVRVSQCIKIKAKAVDEKNRAVGRVTRIFGPVKSPYALLSMNEEAGADAKIRLIC